MAERSIMINKDSFQEKISRLEEKVNLVANQFETIGKNMKQIDGTNDNWKSKTAVAIHDDYMRIENDFSQINVELYTYVLFLKNVLEDYVSQERNIDKAIEEESPYLDVNE